MGDLPDEMYCMQPSRVDPKHQTSDLIPGKGCFGWARDIAAQSERCPAQACACCGEFPIPCLKLALEEEAGDSDAEQPCHAC